MPTETVELISHLEDHFGIQLPEKRWRGVSTPTDLVDLISDLVCVRSGYCQNPKAFNQLRGVLVDSFGISRSEIRLDSDLNLVIPQDQRQRFLERMAQECRMDSIPSLRLPDSYQEPVFYVAALGTLFTVVAAPVAAELGGFLVAGSILGLAAAICVVCNRLLTPYRTRLPHGLSTIEAWVARLAMPQPSERTQRIWSRAEICDSVRTIVTSVLNLEQFDWSWSFVNDMGID